MTDIDFDRLQPLRLSRGSHQPGSGKGCAMNVISYITGEAKISDYPKCADRSVAQLVQYVNDALADDATGFLSPADAIAVVELGMHTIGTRNTSVQAKRMGLLRYTHLHGAWGKDWQEGAVARIATKIRRHEEPRTVRMLKPCKITAADFSFSEPKLATAAEYEMETVWVPGPKAPQEWRDELIQAAKDAIAAFRVLFDLPQYKAVDVRDAVNAKLVTQ